MSEFWYTIAPDGAMPCMTLSGRHEGRARKEVSKKAQRLASETGRELTWTLFRCDSPEDPEPEMFMIDSGNVKPE